MTAERIRSSGRALAFAGVAGVVFGLVQSPERAWAGVLIASVGVMSAGLGGLLFVAISHACGATWPAAFRRVPEAFAAAIPLGAIGLALVFLLRSSIYPWLAEPVHPEGFKGLWLSPAFFFARAVAYIGLWIAFATWILRTSRAQDRDGAPHLAARNVKLSIAFVIVFGLTFWLASVDWIMSLDPHWYSTIFGIYNFAGLFSSALAMIVLAVLWTRRSGVLADFVRDEHLHDLGKLLFAFCTFWMYIWFSQYMLMWYSNIPEEAAYYVRRRTGAWLPLFYLNVALNWVVPFLVLLSKGAKRSRVLTYAAIVVVAGRWVDLYLMIWPSAVAGDPRIGLPELAPAVAAAGLFLVVFTRAFESAPPVPLREPALSASLHYHT